MKILQLFLIALFLFQGQSTAQEGNIKTYQIWGDFGISPIQSKGNATGFGTFLGFGFLKNESLLIQLRFMKIQVPEERNILISTTPEFNEFAFLIGKSINSKYLKLHGSTGLAYIFGETNLSNDRFDEDIASFDTFGIPYETGLMFTPSSGFGLELGYTGNINSKRVTDGPYLKVIIGQTRTQ